MYVAGSRSTAITVAYHHVHRSGRHDWFQTFDVAHSDVELFRVSLRFQSNLIQQLTNGEYSRTNARFSFHENTKLTLIL